MKITVALDTPVLVWALPWPSKTKATQDEVVMRQRARLLLRDLVKVDAKIIVPSIVASEYLIGVPADKRGQVLSEISSRFFCASFDILASEWAAKLWHQARALPKEEQPQQRQVIRADTMIVASAKVAGAKHFYSHDAFCRKVAEYAGMAARDLPTHPENLYEKLSRLDDDT